MWHVDSPTSTIIRWTIPECSSDKWLLDRPSCCLYHLCVDLWPGPVCLSETAGTAQLQQSDGSHWGSHSQLSRQTHQEQHMSAVWLQEGTHTPLEPVFFHDSC